MFKPRLRIPKASSLLRQCQSLQQRSIHATPARCAHSVAKLTEDDRFEKMGVPGLFSVEGFDAAYTNYQGWVLNNLNRLTDGTTFEGLSAKDIAIMTSREPHQAQLFNFASMAHNNHFFFSGISPSGGQDTSEHMPESLKKELEKSFGSLETLQRELILTADAMFGPGFVWLVRQSEGVGLQRFPFRILSTYLAGSPYPGAHWRRQGTDMNSQGGVSDTSGETVRNYFDQQNISNRRLPLHASIGGGSALARAETKKNPGGTELIPVLCVNTWEHAWLFDYGIGGKMNFLSNWWNVIHWGRVAERAGVLGARQMSTRPNPLGLKGSGAANAAETRDETAA